MDMIASFHKSNNEMINSWLAMLNYKHMLTFILTFNNKL
jgi:hypothetical protein